MTADDEPFLRAILAAPADRVARLAYADWLDDRGDPRAGYLRLADRAADLGPGHPDAPPVRRRVVELRAGLPPAWFAALGDHRASSDSPSAGDPAGVAAALGRPARVTDPDGYDREVVAGAAGGLAPGLAYVEGRSRWRGEWQDIAYHLHVRAAGRAAAWEVETYNPFFGCEVGFIGWYAAVVLVIYREKHRTYACRFGVGSPARCVPIEDDWVLDGPHLGYRGYQETAVRRLAVPDLTDLPPLSAGDAAGWEFVPGRPAETGPILDLFGPNQLD